MCWLGCELGGIRWVGACAVDRSELGEGELVGASKEGEEVRAARRCVGRKGNVAARKAVCSLEPGIGSLSVVCGMVAECGRGRVRREDWLQRREA